MKERWQNQLQCFFPPQEMALLYFSTRLPLHHPPRSSTQTYTLPCTSMHKFSSCISWTSSPNPKCMACVDSAASKVHSRPNSSGSPLQSLAPGFEVHAPRLSLLSHLLVLIPYPAARVDHLSPKCVGLLCYLKALTCR